MGVHDQKSDKILEIEDLQTYYGRSHIIQGLSMYINRLEAVSILGRNGVGKTTTLRSILGLTPARAGQIKISGRDTTRWPTHKVIKCGIGYVPAGYNSGPPP